MAYFPKIFLDRLSGEPPNEPRPTLVSAVGFYVPRDRVVPPQVSGSYDFTLSYDARGRLSKYMMGTDTTPTYEYVYDAASNVVERKNYFNGVSLLFGRDALNRATRRDISRPGSGFLSKETYGYDRLSRMHTVKNDQAARLDQYDYDQVDQLDSAKYGLSWNGTAWVNPSRAVSYAWDKVGNRDGVTDAGQTTAYTSNAINEYTAVAGAGVGNAPAHQISSYQTVNYAYISDTYLTRVSSPGNTPYELRYDALGRCVQRLRDGVTTYYLFDDDHWITEYTAAGADITSVLYGLGIDEVIARGGTGGPFLMQDWLGSTSMAVGFAGEVLEKYSYDAFGAPTIKAPGGAVRPASTIGNTFMFTGREYQSTFGIYEYRNRAYHPGSGRFMSEDPVGLQIAGAKPSAQDRSMFPSLPETFADSEFNLYRYCHNDPVNNTDPMGLLSDPATVNSETMGTATWDTMPQAYRTGTQVGAGILLGPAIRASGLAARAALPTLIARLAPAGVIAKGLSDAKIDSNKLNHIFNNRLHNHNLGGLVNAFRGSQERAAYGVLRATEAAVRSQGIKGEFKDVQVAVAGQTVTVRGNVIDGAVRINTFFVKSTQ